MPTYQERENWRTQVGASGTNERNDIVNGVGRVSTASLTARATACGVASLILAVAGLYSFSFGGQTSRFAGLMLMSASGVAAWQARRLRYHALDPKPMPKSEGYYLFIVFALAGMVGFLIPPENRVALFRYVFLMLAKALTH